MKDINMKNRMPAVLLFSIILSSCCYEEKNTDPLNRNFLSILSNGAHIQINPKKDNCKNSQGSGIYIGDGIIMTASHILNPNENGCVYHSSIGDDVNVAINDRVLDAKVLKFSKNFSFGENDVALVKIPEIYFSYYEGLHAMPLCVKPPQPNDDFALLGFRRLVPIEHSGPLIQGQFQQGDSGSGIINMQERCIYGIVSASETTGFDFDMSHTEPKSLSETTLSITKFNEIKTFLDSK